MEAGEDSVADAPLQGAERFFAGLTLAEFLLGVGYVCRRDGDVQEIRPGDVVYIEPGEEHWHGATADRYMAHVAIQEADENGNVVTWLEHVSDEEYPSP